MPHTLLTKRRGKPVDFTGQPLIKLWFCQTNKSEFKRCAIIILKPNRTNGECVGIFMRIFVLETGWGREREGREKGGREREKGGREINIEGERDRNIKRERERSRRKREKERYIYREKERCDRQRWKEWGKESEGQ